MEPSCPTARSIHFVHFRPLIINLLLVFQLKNKKEKERMACFSADPIRHKRTTFTDLSPYKSITFTLSSSLHSFLYPQPNHRNGTP